MEEAAEPTPLPENELAPMPNEDALFGITILFKESFVITDSLHFFFCTGDIDKLKKQHEQEMQEFTKTQEVNKARMEQGLQEKLRARRSRKMREEQAQQEE